ncbi:MAG: hypothetical protein HFE30_05525 [Clostridiales bacterium]|nr:hypothetical protein [Clostridiales bacterium]
MTNNITINFTKKTIELSATYGKKAQKYGSPEYKELQEILEKHSDYTVTIRQCQHKHVKNNLSVKGLTYDFMERYITKYDNENITDYENKRATLSSYYDIKIWFIEKYPEAIGNNEKVNKILAASRRKEKEIISA